MRKPFKGALAAVSLAIPLVLGVTYTAGASVGDVTGVTSHNVDQWTMNQGDSGNYILDREEIDGVVKLDVTGPNGEVVLPADFPDFIAVVVAEFGSTDWAPNDVQMFEVIDGTPCYHEDLLADDIDGDEDAYRAVASSEEGTFVIASRGNGLDTAYFEAEMTEAQLDAQLNGGLFADIAGAQALSICS